jgi:DNA-directed RNA polymerase specialized sigma24 family protein
MVENGGSVTYWLRLLKAGDAEAAQPLWNRYFSRLVDLARNRLHGAPCRGADEEDVALSAFDSFCRRAANGRFPHLDDRDDLWKLLMTLTARKSIDLIKREARQKRGGPGIGASDETLTAGGVNRLEINLDELISSEPTPEFAIQVREEFDRLLALLGDAELRQVALLKMEGFLLEEIAARLDCSPRTVQRKLSLIRDLWSHCPD